MISSYGAALGASTARSFSSLSLGDRRAQIRRRVELTDQRIQRRIGMMRGAEISQLDMRFAPQAILQGDGKSRFFKAGFG